MSGGKSQKNKGTEKIWVWNKGNAKLHTLRTHTAALGRLQI